MGTPVLMPMPKHCLMGEGEFHLSQGSRIVLDQGCGAEALEWTRLLRGETQALFGFLPPLHKQIGPPEGKDIWLCQQAAGLPPEGYSLRISRIGVEVLGADGPGLFYGVQTLRQLMRLYGVTLPALECEDWPDVSLRGYYQDVTRGRVPKLETLMELADRAAFYKLNHLQFYLEHAFAYRKHSEVWSGADPLTPEEILLLDEHCQKRCIDLVPSISPFGHLYHALRSKSFSHLCELGEDQTPFSWMGRMRHHTLDVSNEGSFAFAAEMIDEIMPLFSSRYFNICSDETFDLGMGKSRGLAEKVGKDKLYVDFLKRLIHHVKSHGKQVLFWGDIILKYPERLAEIPQDALCLNWDYAPQIEEKNVQTIARSGLGQIVCPGVSGWNRLMNDMDGAEKNIRGMIRAGHRHGAMGVLNTDWGDFGHINALENSLPGMAFGAALSWNAEDDRRAEAFDAALSRLEYGDESGRLVGLLRRLSLCEKLTWYHYALWYEHDSLGLCPPEYARVEAAIEVAEPEALAKAAADAAELAKELERLAAKVFRERRGDLATFVLSARGIELFQGFWLAVKELDLGEKSISFPSAAEELPRRMEEWLYDYQENWRRTCKESELSRIRTAVQWAANWLRGRA